MKTADNDQEYPMPEEPTTGAPDSVRAQLLSTEHWSLLATRTQVWNESFSRASWFVTVVSATVVALALVAEGTGFGRGFQIFALLLLPLLILIGLATFIRLLQLNAEDVWLVRGMNRLRRGYLDIAPELERYFVTSQREDMDGIMRTYGGTHMRIPAIQYLSSIALLVSIIDAVLVGALTAVICDVLGAGLTVDILAGALAVIAALAGMMWTVVRMVNRTWSRVPRS